MKNDKLLDLLGSFTPEEKQEFPLFLDSPFFVRKRNAEAMLRLFNYLVPDANDPEQKTPDKALVHAWVFPDKTYSEPRLEKTFALFRDLVEQFLSIRYYQRADNKQQQALDFVRILRKKNLMPQYEKKLQKIKKEAKENATESAENYHFLYQIAREEHEWRSLFNAFQNDIALTETIGNLDLFCLSERTELSNRLLLQQKVAALKESNKINLDLAFFSHVQEYEAQSPLIYIRRKIQALFLENKPSKEAIESLMNLIYVHEKGFSEEDIQGLFTYMRNFCTLLGNRENNHTEKLEIYKMLHKIHLDNLARGYFYYNGQIGLYSVINIVKIALKVDNITWAKQFLTSHRNRILGEDEAEEHYNLCMALCLFNEHNYEQALQYISNSSNFPFLFLECRRLELKIYYELHSDLIWYKIDAFRKYLERTATKLVSTFERQANQNFVNLLLQLVQSKPRDAQRSLRLIKRIEEKKNLAENFWLLKKAQALA